LRSMAESPTHEIALCAISVLEHVNFKLSGQVTVGRRACNLLRDCVNSALTAHLRTFAQK